MTDRERILVNIAAMLASELDTLQRLPAVQQYINSPHSLSRVRAEWDLFNRKPTNKGDLVVCQSSVYRQQNPWLISFVEGPHGKGDESGLRLRAIGKKETCDYGNESFIRITGIPERFLWEGDKHAFSVKLSKALRKLNSYGHRFRGLKFKDDKTALVYIGEVWGGLGRKTKPYCITITFNKRATIKEIVAAMKDGGFGTREFEMDDGTYDGPMQGCATITRSDLIGTLDAAGIELKPEIKSAG
jgi:hypothetical protein